MFKWSNSIVICEITEISTKVRLQLVAPGQRGGYAAGNREYLDFSKDKTHLMAKGCKPYINVVREEGHV